MIVKTLDQLPEVYICNVCTTPKPIGEMILVRRRKTGDFLLRPRCKQCHNLRERGHRREYKRKYLRTWRKWNPELNESYWRQRNEEKRQEINRSAYMRFQQKHHALLIQGRLRRRLGMSTPIKEAQNLLRKFGPCYPTPQGLTSTGLKECERIRSAMRRMGKKISTIEIRMMVYDDDASNVIKPSRQKIPFSAASERLKRWHAGQPKPRAA